MSQQGRRQASVRAVTGTSGTYEGDWHALFDRAGIPAGPFNGRMLTWINTKLSRSYTSLTEAQEALAAASGARDWGGLGTFSATTSLPDFALQSETTAAANARTAAGATVTSRNERHFDYWVRKWKTAGVWAKLTHLWIIGDHEAASLVNLRNPGTNNLTKVSTPTWVTPKQAYGANATNTSTGLGAMGWKATAVGTYLDTGIALNSITGSDCTFGAFMGTGSATSSVYDCGAQDGSNGFMICAHNNAVSNVVTVRAMGPTAVLTGTAALTDTASGFWAFVRNNTANVDVYHNARKIGDAVSNTMSQSAASTTLTFCKANGQGSQSLRAFQAGFLGAAMTAAQIDLLYRGIRQILENNMWGDYLIHETGYAPQNVSADIVIYGWTASAVISAYEAKRQGRTVVVVGGWRDRTQQQIGGMPTNGLAFTDFKANPDTGGPASGPVLGGLSRLLFRRGCTAENMATSDALITSPRALGWVLRQMCDASKPSGLDVDFYATGGVTSVQKTGAAITSVTTADGRVFSGSQFIDHSYEGDLMALAGVSYTVGREAAGSGTEALNGWRGTLTSGGSTNGNQFAYDPGGASPTFFDVDPYLTPGNAASGFIAGVVAKPAKTGGQADETTQAYNFRVTMTTSTSQQTPIPSTAPSGYSAARYEAMGRLAALLTAGSLTLRIDECMESGKQLTSGLYDFNHKGGLSLDMPGGATSYTQAGNYAARETIWKDHEAFIRGMFYYIAYDADSRVSSQPARTTMRTYGFPMNHYLDPHPNDEPYWPSQLYVREFRRMQNDLIWTANDINATDGGTPRSTKTIAVASYAQDSHIHTLIADEAHVPPRLWNEGGFYNPTGAGGSNFYAPLPAEIYLPRASECTNLAVGFAVASTHVAFGTIRMEATAMLAAQSLAIGAAKAVEDASTIQAAMVTNYSALRTRLLASATLTNEINPILPQVN